MTERPDSDAPRCGCGCAQLWSDRYHMWLCVHCDNIVQLQQTVQQSVEERRHDELLHMSTPFRADGNLPDVRPDAVAAPGREPRREEVS
jgi:hypothetical protein